MPGSCSVAVFMGRMIYFSLIRQSTIKSDLRTNLHPGELPGRIRLILDNQWQPLPSLTPMDQLHDLRVFVDGKPIEHFELARSAITGQILIRNNLPTTTPVTVEFIITPHQRLLCRTKTRRKHSTEKTPL